MIIESITIENFRCFYSEVEFQFSTGRTQNTTLIFAQNGIGKTNLLNAFLWCFHGETSNSLKITTTEGLMNKTAVKEGRKSFHVSIEFEKDGSRYRIKRTGGNFENFKIWMIDGGNTTEVKQNPSLFINSIIPKDMTSYFINDGEGEDLAINVDGTISVSRSITDILGFGIAQKTLFDLGLIKKEYRKELVRHDSEGKLADIQQRIGAAEESLRKNTNDLNNNEKALEEYERELEAINRKLANSNSELIKKNHEDRVRLERQVEGLQKKLLAAEAMKPKLIRKYYSVAFADGLSSEALDFIKDNESRGKIPAPWNEEFVNTILERAKCICGAEVKKGTDIYTRIESMLKQAANPDLVNRISKARAQLTSVKTLKPYAKQEIDSNRKDIQELGEEIRRFKGKIDELSLTIESGDDIEKIAKREKERRVLQSKVVETSKTIGRKADAIKRAKETKEKAEEESRKLRSFEPKITRMKKNIEMVEKIEAIVEKELEEANSEYPTLLVNSMNEFLQKHLSQDYVAKIDRDSNKIGLTDRHGDDIGVSEGQGALLQFIYISSLVNIARSRRDLESNILTPGAVAPLIFDAPFSDLDPSYARSIAGALPGLVDQLIIISYPDSDKDIAKTINETGKLDRVYYLQLESEGPSDGKEQKTMVIDGQSVPAVIYNCPKDKVNVIKGEQY